jgi:hypothetical protein
MTPNLAAMVREMTEESVVAQNVQRHTITLEKIYLGKLHNSEMDRLRG